MQQNTFRMIELADGSFPSQLQRKRISHWIGRVDGDVKLMALQHAVRLATGIVATAFIQERRHGLGHAFAIADADLQFVGRLDVRLGIGAVLLFPLLAEGAAKVKDLFVTQKNFMAATVNGCARLNHDVLIAAGGVGMGNDLQAAHRSPAVQVLVMAVFLAEKEALLISEIALYQQFSGEEMIARQLRDLTLDAAFVFFRAMSVAACHGAFLSPQLSNVHAPMRVLRPTRMAGGPCSSRGCPSAVSYPSFDWPSTTSFGSIPTTVSFPI